jgi:glycosyltransferase involved in cell wall biosynthesis
MADRRERIVCLLPARNVEATLPGWLDEAPAFCDAVVALDDGSTDGTPDVLKAHPVVAKLLRNPRRDSYLGWHDGVNRNRLLVAAAELHPEWIVSIDSDERLDPTDAAALRGFALGEALSGCAYGFQVFRMMEGETYDPNFEWVFRLFRFREGQRFPQRRFDFTPVPTSIPDRAWVRTTLRIKHYGDVDEEGRLARVAKYREADPEGTFRDYYENLATFSDEPPPPWVPRQPDQPVLVWSRSPETPSTGDAGAAPFARGAPFIVCLLPARNCLHQLPGWFESVSRFADSIVALDDGSTDGTGDYLRSHPLVASVLTNPTRTSYEDWDDAANRDRLLEAAGDCSPDWVIFLDADERIPMEDGVALRRFLADQAEQECAYGFPVYRMIGDLEHYDRLEHFAYRMFAFEPGLRLTNERLHGVPVPTSIPRDRWLETTIRIQHLSGLTETDRRARWDKYREADPERLWEPDYEYTRIPVGAVQRWPARSPDVPVLGSETGPHANELYLDDLDLDELDLEGPVLSVVLLIKQDAEAMIDMLRALADAPCSAPFELLGVTDDPQVAGQVKRAVPAAKVIRTQPSTTAGAARNAAVRAARGDYVTFFVAPGPIGPGMLDAVVDAHEQGHALVAGQVVLDGTGAARVASELLEASSLRRGAGEGDVLPVPCSSFARASLLSAGGFDEQAAAGVEALATRRLLRLGLTATVVPALALARRDGAGTTVGLIRQRFELGRLLNRSPRGAKRAGSLALLRASANQFRASRSALADAGDHRQGSGRVVAVLAAAATATWAGATFEALRRHE